MIQRKPGLVLLCVTFGFSFLFSTLVFGQDTLRARLEKIVGQSGLKKADMGLLVTDQENNTVFENNSQEHFIPASITKLITSAAIFQRLGPYYRFHTKVFVDGPQSGSTLNGNIYLKGGGDPAFVSERLWMLVNDFTREDIKKITGNLIVDDSAFDDERFDPGREPERNDRAYDAPVGALSFNWNSTTIFVRPGAKAGEAARTYVDPDNDYITLKNEAVTSKKGSDLSAGRATVKGHDVVTVSGKIAEGSEEKHIYKNISNPALYAGYNFREFLRQRGIQISGQVTSGQTPSSARLAADHEGEPITKLIIDMNKFSNNFVAEMLTKGLGAYKTEGQGKMADGLNEVKAFLDEDLKVDPKSYVMTNASGLSRRNSFTAKHFVQVLSWIKKQFKIYPEYLASLPVAGIDGTLKKRLKNDETSGWVRAKTGLLTGVVALAGYAGRKDSGVYVFTFMYNGHANEAHVRSVFDELAASLVTK